MKNITLFFVSFLFSIQAFSQSPNWLWAEGIGGAGQDACNSIAIDASGNFYATGYFSKITDFDPGAGVFNLTSGGGQDIFIAKFDSTGSLQWAKRIGSTLNDVGFSIAVEQLGSSNIYVTGYFFGTVDFDPGAGVLNLSSGGNNQDIFVMKLDSAGNFIWATDMGGPNNDLGYSLVIDPSDSNAVFTTGAFSDTADFDSGAGIFNLISVGQYDIFVSKLDSSGNFVWAKAMSGTSYDYGYSIALDVSGNVYTTGYFGATVDFDPGPAIFNLTTLANKSVFISKLDHSGNFIWAKRMGGSTYAEGHSIAIDAAYNVYSAGEYQGPADFDPGPGTFNLNPYGGNDIFISKLDSAGNFIWAKGMGGTSNGDWGLALALDDSANVFSTGYFGGIADFNPGADTFNLASGGFVDAFISELDSAGNFVWAKPVSGSANEAGYCIALSTSGNIYAGGYFQSLLVSFESLTLTNDTTDLSSDLFIAKLDNTIIITGNNETENSVKGINLFPNPATNELTIDNGELKIEKVELYNAIGKVELNYQLSIINYQLSIDVSQLPPGIYFITVTNQAGNKVTKKVVKL